MIGFLALLLINAALFFVSTLLIQPPKFPDATPDDPNGPRADEGSVLPVVFGTCRLAAQCTMFTNTRAVEQKTRIKTGIFSSRNVTTGFSYEALMQIVLCHGPVDELVDIVWQNSQSISGYADETSYQPVDTPDGTVYQPVSQSTRYVTPLIPMLRDDAATGGTLFDIQAPNLFGGKQHGGGVTGPMRMYWGLPNQILGDQTVSGSMESYGLAGAQCSNWEGISYLTFGSMDALGPDLAQRFNFGEFGTVPELHVIVRRCPNGLGVADEVANLNGGANIACAIYDVLTNTVWGAAIPADQIDTQSFIDCAITLASENLGVCISLTSQQTSDAVVTEFLRYADGQVQQHPVTGLLTMSLNRPDYVFEDLPLINESVIEGATYARPGWTEMKNEIKVSYTRRLYGQMRDALTQPLQDIANQRNFGAVNSVVMSYPGVFNETVANTLATRDLRKQGLPLAQVKGIKADRRTADWVIGKPFRFYWAKYGLANVVMRVAQINYGNPLSGDVIIDAVEDIFGMEEPLYSVGASADLTLGPISIGLGGIVYVDPEVTSDGVYGYLELHLTGGFGRVQSVQFSEESGTAPAAAWHDNTDPAGFKTQVLLDSKHESHIAWRVIGTLADGTVGELESGSAVYPINRRPDRPRLEAVIDPETGVIDVTVFADTDTVNVKVAGAENAAPDLADVEAEDPVMVAPGGQVTIPGVLTLEPGETGYISAIAINDLGNESPLVTTPVSRGVPDVTPTVDLVYSKTNPLTGLIADVALRIASPLGLGGTLRIWTNHGGTSSPAYNDPIEGTVDLAVTPVTVDETTSFTVVATGLPDFLLDNIRVHASQGKTVYAEFIDTSGHTSGQKSFYLAPGGGVIDENGQLKDQSIQALEQFASNFRPPEAFAEPFPDRPDGTIVFDLTTGRQMIRESGAWVDLVSAPNLSGLLTGSQILDATITPSKVASSATLPQVVANISSANSALSLMAFETSTGKLYRWNGSGWVATVASTDISGTITAGQLAGGIDATKLASGLTLPQIVSDIALASTSVSPLAFESSSGFFYRYQTGYGWVRSTPASDITGQITTTQITPGSITTPLLGALAVQAGNVAAGAITAGKIATDAVTAGTVAAAAIGAREIAAGSITADKFFSYGSTGAALNQDPNTADASAWYDYIQGGPPVISLRGLTVGKVGMTALSSQIDGPAYIYANQFVPLDPAKVYRVRGWVYNAGANGVLYLGVQTYDGSLVATSMSGGGGFYTTSGVTPPNGVWSEWVGYVGAGQVGSIENNNAGTSEDPTAYTAGAAKFMRLYALLNYVGTAGYMLLQDFRLEEVLPGTLIQGGAISTDKLAANAVQAGNIAAGAVTAGKLAANSVVAGNIDAGIITGREINGATITTDKLLVTSGGGQALNIDPEMKDTTAWGMTGAAPALITDGPSGINVLRSTNDGSLGNIIANNRVPVDQDKVYRFSVWLRSSAVADGVVYLGGTFRNGDGTNSNLNGGYIYAGNSGTRPPNTWTKYAGVLSVAAGTIPASASYFFPILYLNYGATAGYMEAQDFRVEEVLPGTLIKDGAIVTGHMAANSISGDRIQAGTLDANKVDAATISAATAFLNNIQAGVVTAAAIKAKLIGADKLTATQISIGSISELSQNTGIILAGILYNTSQTWYLNLNASAADPGAAWFIYTDQFRVRNDGYVYISGELYGTSGIFSGTIASSSFTTSLADFAGKVYMRGTLKIIGGGTGFEEDGLGGITFNRYSDDYSYAKIYLDGVATLVHRANAGIEFHAGDGANSVDMTAYSLLIHSPYNVLNPMLTISNSTYGNLFQVDVPTVNNDSSLSILYRTETGVYIWRRVRGDNAGTGGAGNRPLRILN